MLELGPYCHESRVVVAPMAGVTDRAFRDRCREFGSYWLVSEMVTSDQRLWHTPKSQTRLAHIEESGLSWVQLAGAEPALLAAAAREKKEKKYHDKAKADMKAGKSVAWYLDRKQGAGQKWSTGTETWFAAQDYMKKFKEDIDEAKKQGLKLKCQECGKVFTKQIGPKTVEVQCPKCKGFDVDVAEEVDLDEATKWKMGDGRPRGAPHIENIRYWDLSAEELRYIMKDAGEAMKANPKARKATTGPGNWADQVNDAHTVLGWRKKKGIKEDLDEAPKNYYEIGGDRYAPV